MTDGPYDVVVAGGRAAALSAPLVHGWAQRRVAPIGTRAPRNALAALRRADVTATHEGSDDRGGPRFPPLLPRSDPSPATAPTGQRVTAPCGEGLGAGCKSEAAVLLAGSLLAHSTTAEPWWLVPALVLLADLAWTVYLGGTRLGANTYNSAHATPLPAMMSASGGGNTDWSWRWAWCGWPTPGSTASRAMASNTPTSQGWERTLAATRPDSMRRSMPRVNERKG